MTETSVAGVVDGPSGQVQRHVTRRRLDSGWFGVHEDERRDLFTGLLQLVRHLERHPVAGTVAADWYGPVRCTCLISAM